MIKMNAKVFFVDKQHRRNYGAMGKSAAHNSNTMVPFTPFVSLQKTVSLIRASKANFIVLGHFLDGVTTGVDVMNALKEIKYEAIFISNTGGDSRLLFPGLERHAEREPWHLWSAIDGGKASPGFTRLARNENEEDFINCLKKKKYEEAITLLKRVKGYGHVEDYVYPVLKKRLVKESLETVQIVLDYFIEQREDFCPEHGYWVHSASHFDTAMWKLGLKTQLQTILKIAIRGAIELSDDNCLGRLVSRFFLLSDYNDDPKDFGLTPETVRFYGERNEYQKKRVEAGVFQNERDYLLLQLQCVDTPFILSWNNDQLSVLDEKKVLRIIKKLRTFPHDGDFVPATTYIKTLYEKQVALFKEKLKHTDHEATQQKLMAAIVVSEERLATFLDNKL